MVEGSWVDPTVTARVLWLATHPFHAVQDETAIKGATFNAAGDTPYPDEDLPAPIETPIARR
jgi:hypothetical protein